MNKQQRPSSLPLGSRVWITGAFVASVSLVGFLTERLFHVQDRLEEVESTRLDQELDFHQTLFAVRQELEGIRGELADSTRTAQQAEELELRLASAESTLGTIEERVETQGTDLHALEREALPASQLEEERARWGEELNSLFDARYRELSTAVSSVEEAARENSLEVQRLEATLAAPRDLEGMWQELVGPVVQLAGDSSVGSGVLLRSRPIEDGYSTFLMTAWHVVRDIQGDLSKTDLPVPVFIYEEDGTIEEEAAQLLAFDADLDAALLELVTDEPFPNGADLAPRERLREIRIFDPIYAVGCPLGNDPIPTRGEVATTRHLVDGEWYWMINAPTYIGNSGGGIFDGSSHELLGIFSKIYTHGTLRPTIVPHMGLVTPLSAIYDWLDDEGLYERLVGKPSASLAIAGKEASSDR